MLIGSELADAINAQIGREFGASLQYVSIASYFENEAYLKLAKFFFEQAEEERDHAMKLLKYVLDAGGSIVIPAIPAPQARFSSVEDAIGLALKWEQEVTGQINNLMDIAVKHKDYIAQQFLNWFTNEQLEEVNTMSTLLQIAKRLGDKNIMLLEAYLENIGD